MVRFHNLNAGFNDPRSGLRDARKADTLRIPLRSEIKK